MDNTSTREAHWRTYWWSFEASPKTSKTETDAEDFEIGDEEDGKD